MPLATRFSPMPHGLWVVVVAVTVLDVVLLAVVLLVLDVVLVTVVGGRVGAAVGEFVGPAVGDKVGKTHSLPIPPTARPIQAVRNCKMVEQRAIW